MTRDLSRDGVQNRLEHFVLSHFGPVWRGLQAIPFSERFVNRKLINRAVLKARTRPHPWSLLSDFTSWDSLTDRTFTGRHLPPADPNYTHSLPTVADVTHAFRRVTGNGRLSSTSTQLFSHFAQWFTDGFLRTDRNDPRKNTSNHEIDLSPLYGRTPAITKTLRSFTGGRLKSQWIGGNEFPPYYFDLSGVPRVEFLRDSVFYPPDLPADRQQSLFAMGVERANVQFGFVMLNTLFLREHNRICDTFSRTHPDWDDERLFQTARNLVIAMLIKVVVEEYINHIAPYHFQFKAQPRSFYQSKWYRTNWMTLEFNLLYRWHGLVTDTIRVGEQVIPVEDTFFNNRLLIDRGLGACFDDASRYPCGAIGLFNTHHTLVGTEAASIEHGRKAHLRPYNAYRQYCGYPSVTRFEQITGEPERQKVLRDLYGTPDRVEFYVGLFAEDVRPGSPLSPLIGRMVGMDAFSQALTNPLLSEHVFNEQTFTREGWTIWHETSSLSDIVQRNLQAETNLGKPRVTFDVDRSRSADGNGASDLRVRKKW